MADPARRKPQCPELAGVRLFHNRLLIDIDPMIPLGKVKPVLRRGGQCERLVVTQRETLPAPAHGLLIEAELAVPAAAGARLEIWAEGYRLSDTALPWGLASLTGGIDGVSDYALGGWVADFAGARPPDGVLIVDGVPAGAIAAPALRHRFNRFIGLQSCAGFSVALPAWCMDGALHLLSARFGGLTLPSVPFRARPVFQVELAHAEALRLWVADRALADDPVTISVVQADGTVLARGLTTPRADVQATTGQLHTGFATRFAPALRAGEMEIRAGIAGQVLLARLTVSDLVDAVAAMREVSKTLRGLEQRLGRSLGFSRDLLQTLRQEGRLQPEFPAQCHVVAVQRPRPITVILPIYRGVAQTRACVESLRASAEAGDGALAQVLLLADAPPEPDMLPMLRAVEGVWNGVAFRLIVQTENLGFVATVNHGLERAGVEADVILLNADTIVPQGFAGRLQHAAYARADIASVTPLSNDATILSLPDRHGGNAIDPAQLGVVDALLAGLPALDIPVGVGFCLFLRQDARADIGPFAVEWQRGYGEEVDWCLKAADRGWTHVAACDVFVFHHGSVSFGAEERLRILARNHALLERRYPDYLPAVRAFLAADPLWRTRLEVFALLLGQKPQRTVLHFSHALGGGTSVLLERAAAMLAQEGHHNLICTTGHDDFLGRDVLTISWREAGLTLRLPPEAVDDFVDRMARLIPGLRILVHSLIGVGPQVHAAAARLALPISFYIHDFQWYCPRVVLVDHTRRYCGEPEARYCQLCVRGPRSHGFSVEEAWIESDVASWVARNGALLAAARRVVVPSHDAARRYQRRFGLRNIVVLPHPEPVAEARLLRRPDGDAVTRIAVIGGISVQKGLDVIRDLGRLIDASGAAVQIRVIGDVEDLSALDGVASVDVSGRYEPAELGRVLGRFHPHLVFFPAVWPETYSFTLSECWACGYPAVAFDIGAIAERITESGGGVVLPYEPEAAVLLPRLLMARDGVAELAGRMVVIGSMPQTLADVLFP